MVEDLCGRPGLGDHAAVDAGEEANESDSTWDYNLDVEEHAEGFCAPNPGFSSICTWDSTSIARSGGTETRRASP